MQSNRICFIQTRIKWDAQHFQWPPSPHVHFKSFTNWQSNQNHIHKSQNDRYSMLIRSHTHTGYRRFIAVFNDYRRHTNTVYHFQLWTHHQPNSRWTREKENKKRQNFFSPTDEEPPIDIHCSILRSLNGVDGYFAEPHKHTGGFMSSLDLISLKWEERMNERRKKKLKNAGK